MSEKKVDFDRFVKALEKSAPKTDPDAETDADSIALRHTSGVTPKDWERVQRRLDDEA
jgi:hypothetical protein